MLAKINHAFIEFMNPIEEKIFFSRGYEFWAICDALLIACILRPDKVIKKCTRQHCTVELQGTHTRGQVVIDHLEKNVPNMNMIEQLHEQACKDMILWAVDDVVIDFEFN